MNRTEKAAALRQAMAEAALAAARKVINEIYGDSYAEGLLEPADDTIEQIALILTPFAEGTIDLAEAIKVELTER